VLRVGNVPATTGYGEPVQSTLNFKDGERVVAAALVPGMNGEQEGQGTGAAPRWLVATARGMGFFCRPDLGETTKSGRRFARTREGDEVIVVAPADGGLISAATAQGKVLVFRAEELAELTGPGRGVILMRVDKGDRLIGAVCHAADSPPIAVAEDGSERRFHLPEPAHRAQKGRKALKRFKPVDLLMRAGEAPPA
jgi:DNA gyrase subunit A